MSLTKKRWILLTLCCLANLCLGSIYAWSVFAAPMAEYLGQLQGKSYTSADLAIVYTVATSIGTVTMIGGGWFNDRFGPRSVLLVGGLLFGGGMILSGFATSVVFLKGAYGVIGGLGLGMAYGCTISTSVKFFPDKRGLTGGLTTAAYGFSSVLLPPVILFLVKHTGVVYAFRIIGVVFCVVLAGSAWFFEKCPDEFCPEGYDMPEKNAGNTEYDKDWKEMLKTPVFYIMMGALTCGAISGSMIISQASAVAINLGGLSAAAAGGVISFFSLFNTAGRLVAGYISDKIGRIQTLLGACALSVVGSIVLAFIHPGIVWVFYGSMAVLGLCFGAFMGVFPGFTADQFGAAHNSVNYGIMVIGNALAAYLGPETMRKMYYAYGTYQKAFLVGGIFGAVGMLFLGICLVMNRKKMRQFKERRRTAGEN